jgi:putative transposase
MRTIHCDNASEFHGSMLERACQNYGIALEWRPIERPHYGGHIERWMGTFATEIHALPGSTFSSPAERGDYDSEGRAVLSLSEFEQWLAEYITGVYHQRATANWGFRRLRSTSAPC